MGRDENGLAHHAFCAHTCLMPTIKDVARRAGVSTATVSRALSKPETVRSDTRDLVRLAVEEMGYRPNGLAQSMRQQSSRSILAMVPDITNPYFATIISAAQEEAAAAGFRILLVNTAQAAQSEDAALALAETKLVDGILQLGERQIGLHGWYASNVPVIHMCEGPIDTGFSTIAIDNVRAMQELVEFLIASGHRDFAFITGPTESRVTGDRTKGAKAALAAAGIDATSHWIACATYGITEGEEALDNLLKSGVEVTAVCCFSDHLAIGAIAAANRRGLRVPDDLSVTGFDDVQYARHHIPPLTTVAQPLRDLGNRAIRALFGLLQGAPVPDRTVLPHEIIVRGSTGSRPLPSSR